jgi:hypothetical protein
VTFGLKFAAGAVLKVEGVNVGKESHGVSNRWPAVAPRASPFGRHPGCIEQTPKSPMT